MKVCTKAQCEQHVGQWVRFQTPYGQHIGRIERVTADQAIVVSPRPYVPSHLAQPVSVDDETKLDMALAFWAGAGSPRAGYGGGYGMGPGRTGGGYGNGAGRPGAYGWGYGWQRWAVSFLIIYALWGLWFW
ncbi:MAG: hypothetical protein OWT28_01420 [Firmicutes bacterium]|nr:hypothetical protein [Bacillota bacterium]